MRRFSSCGILRYAKAGPNPNTNPLKLRPPIEPTVSNVETPDNHPLWQFFGPSRQYIRPASEFSDIGQSWSIPQLRRKSVDDLHTLWYVCLKELNRMNREIRLIHQWASEPGKDTLASPQDTAVEKTAGMVKDTMWRIRHVLSERYHAYRKGELALGEEYPKLLQEFSRDYLTADDSMDSEVTGQLERFQYAFFGINPGLEDNFPEPAVLRGLYTVAKLKLQRYGPQEGDESNPEIRDVREAFLLWTAEHSPEGVSGALQTIATVRESGEAVTDEMETLAVLMANFRKAEADEQPSFTEEK